MRRTSRENAFKLIFEKSVSGGTGEITYAVLTRMMSDDENSYFNFLLKGIEINKTFLLSVIKKYSKGFDIDRIYKIDLGILMVSSFEILFADDVPNKVAVNEALELSKIYSTDNSPSFINGILASVIRDKADLLAQLQDDAQDQSETTTDTSVTQNISAAESDDGDVLPFNEEDCINESETN